MSRSENTAKADTIDEIMYILDSLPESRGLQILNKLTHEDLLDLKKAVETAIADAMRAW